MVPVGYAFDPAQVHERRRPGLVMLVVGAKDGYVGRDGHLTEPGTY